MKKSLSFILIYTLLIQCVFAAGVPQRFPTDTVQMGVPTSPTNKDLIFDRGLGASNPRVRANTVNGKIEVNKDLGVTGAIDATGNISGVNISGTGTGSIGGDLTLGTGVTGDKKITVNRGANNPYIKWSETAQSWVFSNDNVLEKKFGSGSGSGESSGVNGLQNSSFEDFVSGSFPSWTSSGGTVTQGTYANGLEGDLKYVQLVSTVAGQYIEQSFTVPTNFGISCQVDFKKVNVTATGLFKLEALDGSNNVLATANIGILSWQKIPTLSFQCPAAGSIVKVRVTSLAAGTFQGDKAYLGSVQNLVSVSQARLYGTLKYTSATNCSWSHTSATMATFVLDNDCSTPIVSGGLSAPLTKIPGFLMTNAPAGIYYIVANGMFVHSGAGQSTFKLSDSTTTSDANVVYNSANSTGSTIITGKFTYTSAQSNLQIQLAALTPSGTSVVENDSPTFEEELTFTVYYYPLSSETAISPEQSAWLIDANIGGANITSNNNNSSYLEITNGSLDMVVNTSKGSANAEIPCSSTNPSTGLTCAAGSESVGIAFIPPWAGDFEACADFGAGTGSGGVVNANGTFQFVETPNNAQTILQEGGDRKYISVSVNNQSNYYANKVCGTFKFNDVSKRTLRLMNESNSLNSVELVADRSASVGQRDIKITVRPILSQFNRPVLTGTEVTSPGAINPVEYFFTIDSAGGFTNLFGGNLVSSCTNASPHVCTFNSGKFSASSTVVCFVNNLTAGTAYFGHGYNASSTGASIQMWNISAANVNNASTKSVRCFGQKP